MRGPLPREPGGPEPRDAESRAGGAAGAGARTREGEVRPAPDASNRRDAGAGGAPRHESDAGAGEPAPPPSRPVYRRPERGGRRRSAPVRWLRRAGRSMGDFLRRVVEKAEEDNIFFMAGAIAFNVLVALVPLLLAMLGIAGVLLRLQDPAAPEVLLDYVVAALPPVSPEFVDSIRQILIELMARSTELISVGMVLLVWIATRLVGTLRTVLRETFDIQQDRGAIAGKLYDLKMVVVAGALFALNVGLTIALEVVTRLGFEALGVDGWLVRAVEVWYGRAVAFVSIWAMFLLIYRYLPPRRIRWSTCLIAATFTAVMFELMKLGFAWYVANFAHYGATYGGLGTIVVLFLWIYYTSVAFILGGEVAQVVAMQRIRKRQKERLS